MDPHSSIWKCWQTVGEVRVVGGLERAINVWIDAERLAAYQIPVTAVRSALARQKPSLVIDVRPR